MNMFKKRRHSLRGRTLTVTLLVLAAALFGVGALKLWERHRATSKPATLPTQGIVTQDIKEPEESIPDVTAYSVPADQPRRLIMDSIQVDALIQRVGITDQNAIAVPSNVHFAGWFTQSSKPGESGLSIINGHVTGRFNDGIFRNLKLLRVGDVFKIEYGDMSVKEFQVVDVQTLPSTDAIGLLLHKRPEIYSQLNLITCTGVYDKNAQTFNDRVIVVSKRM